MANIKDGKLNEMCPIECPEEGVMSGDTYLLKQQRFKSGRRSSQIAEDETLYLTSNDPLEDLDMEPMETEDHFYGSMGSVTTNMIDEERNLYLVHFPGADTYHWPSTGLRFVVRGPVTIEIEFLSWDKFMNKNTPHHSWMIAGPLFDIKAEPGAVEAVYLPHFVAFQGSNVDKSHFQVAHFKTEGMVLEKPARVEPRFIVLENPSFSPMGVLLRMLPGARKFIPITSTVLLYHQHQHENVTFHLYLVPDDCTIRKAIDDEEKSVNFLRILKPPPVTPLYLGSFFTVSASEAMDINPEEFEFCYRSSRESQHFIEIYMDHIGLKFRLQIKNKNDGSVVWKTQIYPETHGSSAQRGSRPSAPCVHSVQRGAQALLHFVDKYRQMLVTRVTSVDSVLDKLLGEVLTEEQYEAVRAEMTPSSQMRKLFSFMRSWNKACKDKVHEALLETHPHLISDLEMM